MPTSLQIPSKVYIPGDGIKKIFIGQEVYTVWTTYQKIIYKFIKLLYVFNLHVHSFKRNVKC